MSTFFLLGLLGIVIASADLAIGTDVNLLLFGVGITFVVAVAFNVVYLAKMIRASQHFKEIAETLALENEMLKAALLASGMDFGEEKPDPIPVPFMRLVRH